MAGFDFGGEVVERPIICHDCGAEHSSRTGFVLKDGEAFAIYFADWHPAANEAYLDVILGSFAEPIYEDNVTFGCRIGQVAGQVEPACSVVAGGASRSDKPMFGQKLDRDRALTHPRVSEFWAVVDWLVVNDELLHEKVFHMASTDERQ